jgi:hypothetical protein
VLAAQRALLVQRGEGGREGGRARRLDEGEGPRVRAEGQDLQQRRVQRDARDLAQGGTVILHWAPLAVIDGHCLGIFTVILLSLLSSFRPK